MDTTAGAQTQSRADKIVGLIREVTTDEMDAAGSRHGLLFERRRNLQADLSWQPCTSPAVAMLKICIVLDEFDQSLNGLDGTPDNTLMALVSRNCGSVIRWLEKEFGIARSDSGLDFYHTDGGERSSWALDEDGEIPS